MPGGETDPNLNTRPRRRIAQRVRLEEPNCWLCGQPIDMALDHQLDPMGSTVDEIIPRSHGGSALDRENLAHCHRRCNAFRGVKAVTPELRDALRRHLAAVQQHPKRRRSRAW